jgi:hypothetical protein
MFLDLVYDTKYVNIQDISRDQSIRTCILSTASNFLSEYRSEVCIVVSPPTVEPLKRRIDFPVPNTVSLCPLTVSRNEALELQTIIGLNQM